MATCGNKHGKLSSKEEWGIKHSGRSRDMLQNKTLLTGNPHKKIVMEMTKATN